MKGDEEIFKHTRERHDRICVFMDGINHSRNLVTKLRPFTDKIFQLRHRVSSQDQEFVTPDSIRKWNTAEEFMEGAQVAYRESLRLMLEDGPLPTSIFEPGVERPKLNFKSLDKIKFQGRFTDLGGPKSLEMLHSMTEEGFLSLVSRGNMQELGDIWRKEISDDSPMHIKLLFTTIVDKEKMIRRCDRVVLTSTFNLSDGITSDFRISEFTCLKQDPQPDDGHDETTTPTTKDQSSQELKLKSDPN